MKRDKIIVDLTPLEGHRFSIELSNVESMVTLVDELGHRTELRGGVARTVANAVLNLVTLCAEADALMKIRKEDNLHEVEVVRIRTGWTLERCAKLVECLGLGMVTTALDLGEAVGRSDDETGKCLDAQLKGVD